MTLYAHTPTIRLAPYYLHAVNCANNLMHLNMFILPDAVCVNYCDWRSDPYPGTAHQFQRTARYHNNILLHGSHSLQMESIVIMSFLALAFCT